MFKINDLTSKRALPIRLALLVFWLTMFTLGGMAQGNISTVSNNDQATFLPKSAESTLAANEARKFNDTHSLPLLIVASTSNGGRIAPEKINEVRSSARDLKNIQIGSNSRFSDFILGPIVTIPNKDQSAILIPIQLDTNQTNKLDSDGKKSLSTVVEEVRKHIADNQKDATLKFFVSGPAGIAADLGGAFAGIDLTLLLVALVLVFIILLVVYRSLLLPLAVLFTAFTALCGAVLVVYQLAKASVVDLNGQTQGILAILVVGATTDYCLLLISRYREELSSGGVPSNAMSRALRGTWEPILASGGTVIAGLLTLLLSDLSSTASLGPIASIGIIFAMFAALTLLPGLLLVPGKHARVMFWPAKIQQSSGDAVLEGTKIDYIDERISKNHPFWNKISTFVTKRGRVVWVATTVVLVAFAAFAPSFKANGVSTLDTFMKPTESVEGFRVIGDKFQSGSAQPTTVVISNKLYSDAVKEISQINGVATVVPQSDLPSIPGQSAPANTRPTVVDDQVLLNVTTTMPAEDAQSAQVVRNIRTVAHKIDQSSLVGGPAAQNLDTQETARVDFVKIVPVVLLVIFFMLVLLLRSVVAPVLIIVANIVSFASAMGLCALLFNHVFGFSGSDASVPIYAFVFLVALGIDYTIFLMSRVREESRHYGTEVGVRHGVAVTGGVITSAGVVLAATFAALAVVPLLFMVQLAVIVALGIVIDTFIVRSLLVPGVVLEFGDRVWWPSALNKRASDNLQ
ncbi:MMPL family transporter [Arcanobacterium ihumii]|uniref:MMPL family transporter n=1 Tax=Arcanobacterium ihumii TaxID=2138162 RepID=UPI0013588E42|nr:efflux RND transporter permease subunit [Arcanobacterium ihumii]